MTLDELDALLAETLEDHRLSRAEKRALDEVFAGLDLSPSARAGYLNRAFRLAEASLSRSADREVLGWLLELSKVVAAAGRHETEPAPGQVAEVLFTPADDIPDRLRRLIDDCRRSLAICVFTLTDDSLARAIVAAQRRGVAVRVITDDDKADDRGSDVWRLAEHGVAVREDRLPDHMHHKFVVFDRRLVVTGSYNWTLGAAQRNHENLLLSDDPRLVEPFAREFERLWEQFEPLR